MGILHLVATPIGNLEDISARGLRTLREVRLIAAEDTRHTRQLLTHFDIHTPLTSYYEHNKLSKLDAILAALAEGDVALVSDAGTPAINDPGYELVKAALAAGHTVSPVPGASAPIAALAASGLPTEAFLYLGYLPRKGGERRALLGSVAELPYTLIFLETPHRLMESLDDLLSLPGGTPAGAGRQMAAARELTKLHEQIVRGSVGEVKAHFTANEPRGEFTLVVEGKKMSDGGRWPDEQLQAAIRAGLKAGKPGKELAAELAKVSGWPRREVYSLIIAKKQ